jgi:hypothetical protein
MESKIIILAASMDTSVFTLTGRLSGKTCVEAGRSIGVSEVTYRRWRAEFGGLIRTLGPNHTSVEKPRVT